MTIPKSCLIAYDEGDPEIVETASELAALISGQGLSCDLVPVQSAATLRELSGRKYSGVVYFFHGTPQGMLIGGETIAWSELEQIVASSPSGWHIIESCYSMTIQAPHVHGINGGVDIGIAKIDAVNFLATYLSSSNISKEREASIGLRRYFGEYTIQNIQSIINSAFLPVHPLDGGTVQDPGQYVFQAPLRGNTSVNGAWGKYIDDFISIGIENGWIETYPVGTTPYIGVSDTSTVKQTIHKKNLGNNTDFGNFNPDGEIDLTVKKSLVEGPWYSPDQLKLVITATPKSKLDVAEMTGLAEVLRTQGIDVKIEIIPQIDTVVFLQNFTWQGTCDQFDTIQLMEAHESIDVRIEFYIPIATILNYIVPDTGTAIAKVLELMGIRADIICIIDFVMSNDYNAKGDNDQSEESVALIFSIGVLIEGDLDVGSAILKNAIGFDIPFKLFTLGFRVRGDTGFATRAIITPQGTEYQVGLPYELILDFWVRILFFFKFDWGDSWSDVAWYPDRDPGVEAWSIPADRLNANLDTDGDGLSDQYEERIGTTVYIADTDEDGLSDGMEIMEFYTNPLEADSDGDGSYDNLTAYMNDREELEYWYTILHYDPYVQYDSDPYPSLLDIDSDEEGLIDIGPEQMPADGMGGENAVKALPGERTFFTDPTLPDTDFDNLTDRQEVNWQKYNYSCTECLGLPSHNSSIITSGIDYKPLTHTTGNNSCTCWGKNDIWYTHCWCMYPGDTCQQNKSEVNYIFWNLTNPLMKDTDGDGMMDGDEAAYYWEERVNTFHFPVVDNGTPYADFDGDGYINILDPDSDNDKLPDGQEVYRYGTDPLNPDTDGDNNQGILQGNGDLSDFGEVTGNEWPGYNRWSKTDCDEQCPCPPPTRTNPKKADTDGDGVSDPDEWKNRTNPGSSDTDGDGLMDTKEIKYLCNCSNPFTDKDKITDGMEFVYLTKERGITDKGLLRTYLNTKDIDKDGLIDGDELRFGTDMLNPDTDSDGRKDGKEVGLKGNTVIRGVRTDPLNPDTDGDGVSDGDEITDKTNPLRVDTDGDGLTDLEERSSHTVDIPFVGTRVYKTNARLPDTDSDGIPDGDEVHGWHWGINRIVTSQEFPDSGESLWSTSVNGSSDTWWKWKWNRTRVFEFPDPYRGRFQTNPSKADTDKDGIPDGMEKEMVLSPLRKDTDGDGVTDLKEMAYIEQTISYYSSKPGLWKRFDTWHYLDFDRDGLTDSYEFALFGNNWEQNVLLITEPDADADGRTDWEEYGVPITTYKQKQAGSGMFSSTRIEPLYTMAGGEFTGADRQDLNEGTIPASVRNVLSAWGYPLSEGATCSFTLDVAGQPTGTGWDIVDFETAADPASGTLPEGFTTMERFRLYDIAGEVIVSRFVYEDVFTREYTSIIDSDTDGDGLLDGEEIGTYGTNPCMADTDGDGINDRIEVKRYYTSPVMVDTDSDGAFGGWTDGLELELVKAARPLATNPELAAFLNDPDRDDDGIPDSLELMNATEDFHYSDPFNPDVDSNGILDGLETDYDGDGVSDYHEFSCPAPGYAAATMSSLQADFRTSESYNSTYYNETDFNQNALLFVNHTIYFVADTDGDGWTDGDEENVFLTDPLDPTSMPFPAEGPSISSVTPLYSYAGRYHIPLTVRGTGFGNGVQLSLVQGEETIRAYGIVVSGQGTHLDAYLDIPIQARGVYSFVIENPDGQEATFTVPYTIHPPPDTIPSGLRLSRKIPVNFKFSPKNPLAGQQVKFTDLTGVSTEGEMKWYFWDFDGDQQIDSNSQNPVFTYAEPGEYTASLVVSNGKAISIRKTADIKVIGPEPPVARLTARPESGQAPLLVNFSIKRSIASPETSFVLVFGDNSPPVEGTIPYKRLIPHTYTRKGTYTAILTLTDAFNQESTDTAQVTVAKGQPVPIPSILSLSPSVKAPGDPGFTLRVEGSGFITASRVMWSGQERPTTYVSSTSLDASIPASDIYFPGDYNVSVFNPKPGGGLSGNLPFHVTSEERPVPVISQIDPDSAIAGAPALTLGVQGSNFVADSIVRWEGSNLDTTYVNSTALSALVASSRITSPGTYNVSVFTPGPGGGASANLSFHVTSAGRPVPVISQIDPVSAIAGAPGFTLGVQGSDFVADSIVRWEGSNLDTTYVNSTALSALVASSRITSPGTYNVSVFTPGPGGGASANLTFHVTSAGRPVPVISQIDPDSATAGAPGFTLGVQGSDFVADSTVRWEGSNLDTTYVNSTALSALVASSRITSPGTYNVSVFTPGPGGGASVNLAFTVNTPGDTTPPASITGLMNTTYEYTWIRWTWTDPADPDFQRVLVWCDGARQPDVPKGQQYFNATGLFPGSGHTISTRTADVSGNINSTWMNSTAATHPPNVWVTTPNGGGSIEAGGSAFITWEYDNIPTSTNVRIDLLKGGACDSNILEAYQVWAGSYVWSVPVSLAPGSDYRIRITESEHGSFDDSDTDFSVTPPTPRITVQSPNGGETLWQDNSYTIYWTYQGEVGSTAILQLYENGVLVEPMIAAPSMGTGGWGSYSWTPSSLLEGDSYKIRVYSSAYPSVSDMSDMEFSIVPEPKGVTVISPNGGESWARGSTQTIQWSYYGHPYSTTAYISLYCRGSDSLEDFWVRDIGTTQIGLSSYSWTIPTDITPSDIPPYYSYFVKVSTQLGTGSEYEDKSDLPFTIT